MKNQEKFNQEIQEQENQMFTKLSKSELAKVMGGNVPPPEQYCPTLHGPGKEVTHDC